MQLHEQSTAFTYQGQLTDNGSTANVPYDMQLSLYDAVTNGTQQGLTLKGKKDVSNGLFSVALDFGADVFTDDERWLEITFREE